MNLIQPATAALLLALLAACNTVQGAGQDISAGGDAVSDTAQEVEDELSD